MATGSHPDYGLPEAFRQSAIAYARQTSVKEAAFAFNISESAIYSWFKKEAASKQIVK